MFRIAVHPDRVRLRDGSEQSFSDRWIPSLRNAGHEVVEVNWRAPGMIDVLRTCDGFLWWVPPIARVREYARRLSFTLAQTMPDLRVFPDWRSAWHFDDKIAQAMLLDAARLPMPRTHVFWRIEDAMMFIDGAEFPLVLKLASGYRSNNVRLLRTRGEARRWIHRLFRNGVNDLSSPLRVWKRRLFRQASHEPAEQGRVLLQEFVANNAFDTRVTVIGNRVFAFRRANRPNDFRASGSGVLLANPDEIDRDALRLAIHTARTLNMPSIAVDILRRDDEPVLIEVSYYYESTGPRACPGHWIERDGEIVEWVNGMMCAEDALLEMFLARLPQ